MNTPNFPQPGSEWGAGTPRCACAPAASPTLNAHHRYLSARGGEFSAPRTSAPARLRPAAARPTIHPDAAQRLACAVIELAVADYRHLIRCGRIAGGQIQSLPPSLVPRFYRSDFEVQALLNFFKRGGGLDEWLWLARVQIAPVCIRKQLALLDKTLHRAGQPDSRPAGGVLQPGESDDPCDPSAR